MYKFYRAVVHLVPHFVICHFNNNTLSVVLQLLHTFYLRSEALVAGVFMSQSKAKHNILHIG